MDITGLELTPVDSETASPEHLQYFPVNHRPILDLEIHAQEVPYLFQSKGLRHGFLPSVFMTTLAPYGEYYLTNTPFVLLYINEKFVANGGSTHSNVIAKELASLGNQPMNYCHANLPAVRLFFTKHYHKDNETTLYLAGVSFIDNKYVSLAVGYGSDGPVILTSDISLSRFLFIKERLLAQHSAVTSDDLLSLISGL